MEECKIIKERFIKKITIKKNEDVYDLTTEKNHNFFANNILVHNCCEILLRPNEFCNLSTTIIRFDDDKETLLKKVRFATILGILQATLTNFKYINRQWKKNTEEERLLGISLTGLRDHKILGRVSKEAKVLLTEMKQMVLETAKEWSTALNIPMPAATTCVKPEGTTSQMTNTSSGLHARFSPFYIRRLRINAIDPIAKMLETKGFKWEPEVGESIEACNTKVFSFPIKSPETSVMVDEIDALEQLKYAKMLNEYWCEHKASCTIYVREEEWLEVGAWIYKNWESVAGLSFLPYTGAIYKLAPYEAITEEEFEAIVKEQPIINFEELKLFEKEDNTEGAQTLACTGNKCEI